MSKNERAVIDTKWIVSHRGKKNQVNPLVPYAWLVEKELTSSGEIEDTAIIFLTNRECPFHCLMCDLWKNTTDNPVPLGAIPTQIEWALSKMPKAKHIKLYNSGNFFDEAAIPQKDYQKIADLLQNFETVIVESHTKLINQKCLQFRDLLKPKLEIAIGLETVHPEVLMQLNKQMTLNNFATAVQFLTKNNIKSRAFILLKPPFTSEEEGIYWAKKSINYAFKVGIDCCTVIPVRAGNGAMEVLLKKGDFSLPKIESLETVLEYGINLQSGRVFADVWDLGLFSACPKCIDQRTNRLTSMSETQKMIKPIICNCNNHNNINC
ncbi:radical SAM protein [Lutibacter citreus]|uniref:radical SAM protein n=1 Tax=Lutibacter citreus TaxID=2138210 RepID=UPI000DBE2971|nr:radical SAM protein [Lutibacter citreus]